MSTNQPLLNPNALSAIESAFGAVPPVARAPSTRNVQGDDKRWDALEERIAAWAPADGEPDIRTDEDGYVLPNHGTVAVALQVAARLQEAGVGVPLRLGQTANGGINFEWRNGNRTERLTVNARGEAELAKFEDSKLISRKAITLVSAPR